jgi:hypothetical protein
MTAIVPAGVEPEFGTGAFCLPPASRLLILVPESRDLNPLFPPPTLAVGSKQKTVGEEQMLFF